jgi:hypothetical protein
MKFYKNQVIDSDGFFEYVFTKVSGKNYSTIVKKGDGSQTMFVCGWGENDEVIGDLPEFWEPITAEEYEEVKSSALYALKHKF